MQAGGWLVLKLYVHVSHICQIYPSLQKCDGIVYMHIHACWSGYATVVLGVLNLLKFNGMSIEPCEVYALSDDYSE